MRRPGPRIAVLALTLTVFCAAALGAAAAAPAGDSWSWFGSTIWSRWGDGTRGHADARRRCRHAPRAHGGTAAHRRARCRPSHKPRHGASSTAPTAGPAPSTAGLAGPGTDGAGLPAQGAAPEPGGSPGSGGGTEGSLPPPVVHVQVTAVEFRFTLSRTTVPAGKVAIQFVNNGQDEHNLNILSGEGSLEGSFEKTASQGIRDQTVTLRKGSFTLFCSLPEHQAKGMHATLTVQ